MFREASAAWCSALNMPTPGMVKLNVHVKISKDFTTLVVVAQNDNGKIWKTRAKEHIFYDPMQAQATAILWDL